MSLFKKLQNGNDVRGVAIATPDEPKTLSEGAVTFIAAAFASYLEDKTGQKTLRIGVGHDSRLSAKALQQACFAGLGRCEIFDCGLISTPAMFQSTVLEESRLDGAIMITASHLPYQRNGMKFFTRDGALNKSELSQILSHAENLCAQFGSVDDHGLVYVGNFPCDHLRIQTLDMVGVYASHIRAWIKSAVSSADEAHPLAGLHIVLDAGNGSAGFFADHILEPLGADTSGSVFLTPDGTFQNHVPNPEDATAMAAIQKATRDAGADLGVIFDCDGDRAAVVFGDGAEVNRNTLIALLASIVAETAPHSTIVTDSVTSDELTDFLENHLHLKHLRYQRGYKNVINKAIELNQNGERCELAIETSGHGAFKENYFSDDGAYIAIKIIAKMALLKRQGKRIEDLIAALKYPAEAREVRYKITDPDFVEYGKKVLLDFKAFAQSDPRFIIVEPNFEGIRVRFDDSEVQGWMLLRMSLHDPAMPMNIESQSIGGVDKMIQRLKPFFEKYDALVVSR